MTEPVRRKLSIVVPRLPASMEHHRHEDRVRDQHRRDRKAVERGSAVAERLNDG